MAPLEDQSASDALLPRLSAHFDSRGPQLVLVQGPPGSGRRRLLNALVAEASGKGLDVVWASPERLLGLALETRVDDVAAAIGSTSSPAEAAHRLQDRAPVFVPVYGYRPGPMLARWLASLRQEVRKTGAPVITMVADEAHALEPLLDEAAFRYDVGDLNARHVRSRLAVAGRDLDPPLSELELDAYVQRLLGDPTALEALTTLFSTIGPKARA